jgi:putative phosphoesterase
MKILVLSDSHSSLGFMRFCVDALKPDHVVHLGDYFEDGSVIAEEFPHIRFHQVPGNRDHYRCVVGQQEILCYSIGGVRFYMTHGHKHWVKNGTDMLIDAARKMDAKVVLYGHTHSADCRNEEGLWVLNPGSCGYFGGTVGLIQVENGVVISCRVLNQTAVEALK